MQCKHETTNAVIEAQITDDDLLAGLEDPDAHDDTPQFQFNEEVQYQILAAMFHEPEILGAATQTLDARAFTDRGMSSLARIAIDYYKSFEKCPPKLVLKQELERMHKDRKHLVYYLAVLNKAYDYIYQFQAREWIKGQILMFAKATAVQRAFHNYLKGLTDGKLDIDDLHKAYCDEFEKIKALQVSEEELVGLDAVEFFDHASQAEREWLLDGWLAERSIHLFAGEKKLGKSTLVLSMIPSLITGRPWFNRLATVPCHVLYIDFENPLDYIRDNLLANMPREDWEAVRDRLSIPKVLPSALTGEWLTSYIQKNGLLGKKLAIFVDSAFAAFNSLFAGGKRVWENTGSDVRTAILPLAEVARKTGAAISLVHHDNKSGDTTGSGQWEGAVDYVWHYTKETSSRRLTAKWGRWVSGKPTALVFQYQDRLLLAGTTAETKQKVHTDKLAELLSNIPDLELDAEPTEATTVTQTSLREQTGWSVGDVSERLAELEQMGRIRKEKLGEGNRSRLPWRYWQHSCLS